MRLLDSDVMIDLFRGYQPACDWFALLRDDPPRLPGLVAMELAQGCSDKQETQRLRKRIESFSLVWPSKSDCRRAFQTFVVGHLTHSLGLLDALIGECAVGLDATLCSFNTKHFQAVPNLRTEQPYPKS